jgi:excisionase family DNA binding protein
MKRGKKPKSVATAPISSDIMTAQEVADYLHCHYYTVYRMVRRGTLPVFRLGGDYRFRRSDIDQWIAQRSVSAGEDVSDLRIHRRKRKS